MRLTGVPLALGEPVAEASLPLCSWTNCRGRGMLKGRERLEKVIMSARKHAVKGGERLPDGALQALADEMVQSGITPMSPWPAHRAGAHPGGTGAQVRQDSEINGE